MLGHSISRYTNAENLDGNDEVVERCANVDMVLIHLPGVISDEERRRLEQVGWTLVPVERVYGPMDIAQEELRQVLESTSSSPVFLTHFPHSARRPHFTKFRAFDFTQYDHILMLESDTLVVSPDVYRIFDLDLDFAGVRSRRLTYDKADAVSSIGYGSIHQQGIQPTHQHRRTVLPPKS